MQVLECDHLSKLELHELLGDMISDHPKPKTSPLQFLRRDGHKLI